MLRSNIFVTGFSGSGKTTVAREITRRLDWSFVDTDDEVVKTAGKGIESIFRDFGEPHFRRLEREALISTAAKDRQVVSTGGGMVVDEGNRRIMEESGVIVYLDARPETIHHRLDRQGKEGRGPVVRPMLEAENPLERIRTLKSERQSSYSEAHWIVHTDHLTPVEAAEEAVRGWRILSNRASQADGEEDLAATVVTSSGDYPVWVGWGLTDQLGDRTKGILSPQAAYVISDEGTYRHGRRAQLSLESAGIPTHMFIMPSGEASKTMETVQLVYRWLAGLKAERGHLVVAVGGGMVGDLAGFAAASYLRGMPFAQVPTSLLGMLDAAIGGKVAVDLPQGKNLVGAFYQPRFVLADVESLQTLPQRELTSGWAEAIKHGLILDDGLLGAFERQTEDLRSLERETATDIIRRSVAIKAEVVSQDEKETLGTRILLNYGHTIGHAIEAATGYERFLHGEAVSVGMMGAAYIGQGMGLMSAEEVERQATVLGAFGLPISCGDVDLAAVADAMKSDKKTSGRTIRWVLLDGIGKAVTRSDVPAELVERTLERLAR